MHTHKGRCRVGRATADGHGRQRGRGMPGDWGVQAAFMGRFTNKVDRKGRVSVPAPYRQILGQQNGVVLMRSFRADAIEGFTRDVMSRLSASVQNPFGTVDAAAAAIFGEAMELSFDGEGRVLLPDGLRLFAKIDETASFLGCGNYFQIWEPKACDAHCEARFQRLRSGEQKVELSLSGGHDAR